MAPPPPRQSSGRVATVASAIESPAKAKKKTIQRRPLLTPGHRNGKGLTPNCRRCIKRLRRRHNFFARQEPSEATNSTSLAFIDEAAPRSATVAGNSMEAPSFTGPSRRFLMRSPGQPFVPTLRFHPSLRPKQLVPPTTDATSLAARVRSLIRSSAAASGTHFAKRHRRQCRRWDVRRFQKSIRRS